VSVRAQADASRTRPARRRPAARRNPDAAGAGRIQWDRVGRIAFVVLCFVLLFSYASPLLNLAKTYRQAGATKVELHRVQAENARLERRVRHVRGDAVLRREARRQGMIVPGETPYVVNGIKP
jgi:cell division protein FtsB